MRRENGLSQPAAGRTAIPSREDSAALERSVFYESGYKSSTRDTFLEVLSRSDVWCRGELVRR